MTSGNEAENLTDPTAAKADFGLFVVWPAGRIDDQLVLERLAATFEILDVTETVWTPQLTARGYGRFYQMVPPYGRGAVDEKGVGATLVVAVRDPEPDHRGGMNLHFGQAHKELAGRLGAGRFHAADNEEQAIREYMLLLERDAAAMLGQGAWTGSIERVERDLAGTGGWTDVRHMFSVLNTGGAYVVLRNYEGLADLDFLPGHTDIDILTSDYSQTIAMLGAESRLRALPKWGGRFDVTIGSRSVICDLRFPGDEYYEPAWAREILRTRRMHCDGFYVPEEDELLDTMLYHAVVHKPEVRPDYQTRLADLASERNRTGWDAEALADRRTSQRILDDRLGARGYSIRRPKDPTVFFNNRLKRSVAPIVWHAADAVRRRIYRFALRNIRYPLRLAGVALLDMFVRPVALLRRARTR